MNSDVVQDQSADQGDHPVAEVVQLTAGQMLRAARQANGQHVAALAVSMKVPVRKLELLEADAYEQLPDAVFIRALASSVCRALKIDAKPILDKLPQTVSPRLDHEERQVGTPFRAPGDGPKPGIFNQLNLPAAFAVLVLLLAAVVLIFLPDVAVPRLTQSATDTPVGQTGAGSASVVSMATGAVLAPSAAGTQAADKPVADVAQSSSAPPLMTTTTASSTQLAVTSTLSGPSGVAAASPVTAAPAPLAKLAQDVPADSLLVLKARGQTWVEVMDARGQTTLRRLLQSGESVGASGFVPLSVTVGRADVTEVMVRGKPFDLTPVASKDLVARFKVQ